MRSPRIASLLWKTGCGLALMLLGAAAAAHAGPDSPPLLFGLFSHLVGLLCLVDALRPLLFGAGSPRTAESLASQQVPGQLRPRRFGRGFLRLLLTLLLLITPAYGLWSACADLSGLMALYAGGSRATAQVIGREIILPDAPTGYVHFAFRARGVAVESRFAVPHAAYPQYWTGRPLSVTYLTQQPRVFRLGAIDAGMIARRGLFWLLLLLNGLVFFGTPLRWLNHRE